MKIYGYSNTWSVEQNETIDFKVHCQAKQYQADIVRLYQTDDQTEGLEYRESEIQSNCSGCYPGREQPLREGSYLWVPDHPALAINDGLTITVWIWPTTPELGVQGILSKSEGFGGSGYALFINNSGQLAFQVRNSIHEATVCSEISLQRGRWYFAVASYDGESGDLTLLTEMIDSLSPHWLKDTSRVTISGKGSNSSYEPNSANLVIAGIDCPTNSEHRVSHYFNGKLDRPKLFSRRLEEGEIEEIRVGGNGPNNSSVASWDFSAKPFGLTVPDKSKNSLAAHVVNNPARAVTDHNWDGSTFCFASDPEQYSAIHFHDDDLDDARWETDFRFDVPKDLPSGVYAARLVVEQDEEDYVPFVVRPNKEANRAKILFVLPTFSYMAYANERFHAQEFVQWDLASDRPLKLSRQDQFVADNAKMLGPSTYDAHTDGFYTIYSSRLRPVLNFRPKLTSYWSDAGRHFGADMYLIDWLDRKGFAVDVATDEDLDIEGEDLLSPYNVILLGSHPEYTSRVMRSSMESYLAKGGNMIVLGGNGCWWITSRDPERPHIIEIRKSDPWGLGAMGALPGEEYHSTTGEIGGAWRGRGKGPERLFGSGYTSQGFCKAEGYRRMPDSFDPSVEFIFSGIDVDEIIGDFGLGLGGAAGDEFDCVRPGSPPNTLQLASSSNHSEYCLNFSMPYNPKDEQVHSVRSDLSYYETIGGGAVFSTGSMCWCPALPINNYDNNVSRITENVLRKFEKK